MADEQAALLAQIAALSGAIKSHKSSSSSTATAAPSPAYWASRGSSRSGSARGGRGGGAAAAAAVAAIASTSSASRNRSLVIAQQAKSNSTPEGWVKKKSTHNMSLVSTSTFERTEPARLAALAAKQQASSSSSSSSSTKPVTSGKRKATTGVRRGDNMGEVIIDGVTFVFDSTGTKLVKASTQPASTDTPSASLVVSPTAAAAADATPLRTNVNGQRFIRTKNGNLISAELLHKRKEEKLKRAKVDKLDRLSKDVAQRERLRGAGKAPNKSTKPRTPKGLCSFFNTTGRCQRGLSCPFTHDVSRLAICRGALRPTGCTLPPGTCLLSHKPTPERAPHCMHFLNARSCRNGDDCLYTHAAPEANVTPTTPACAEFQRVGWCSAGAKCPQRHTWECPDFAREGKCERKGCRLQHVIRAGAGAAGAKQAEEMDYLYVPPTGDLDDGDLFTRDDAAASLSLEALAKEDEALASKNSKRQRDASDEEEQEEEVEHEGTSFKPRKKMAKEFTMQKDFIGFGDEESEDDSSSEEEEEQGSVHSDEDMDLSEGDSEGVEDMQFSDGEAPQASD